VHFTHVPAKREVLRTEVTKHDTYVSNVKSLFYGEDLSKGCYEMMMCMLLGQDDHIMQKYYIYAHYRLSTNPPSLQNLNLMGI
jgi:hypothetical protein